jgi:hypothetical protein
MVFSMPTIIYAMELEGMTRTISARAPKWPASVPVRSVRWEREKADKDLYSGLNECYNYTHEAQYRNA